MNWRCLWLWWHRLVEVRAVSAQSDYLRCSCGREYGLNHDVRVVVPYEAVRNCYERRQR